jgi:hypothetical protein
MPDAETQNSGAAAPYGRGHFPFLDLRVSFLMNKQYF